MYLELSLSFEFRFSIDVSPSLPNSPQQIDKCSNLDNTFGVSQIMSQTSEEQGSISSNSQAPDSLLMTDLDSLMPYEQSYDSMSHSNLISIDPEDKVPRAVQPADNWLMTNTGNNTQLNDIYLNNCHDRDLTYCFCALSAVSSNNLKEQQSNNNAPRNLAATDCASSSSIPPNKNDQESMCYSSSDEAYHNGSSNQRFIPAVDTSSKNGKSEVVQSIDSSVIDETVSENLISFEADVTPVSLESLEIQNVSDTTSPQMNNPNSESLRNFESSRIKNCSTPDWNALISDQNSNETNQSKAQVDNSNQFTDNDNCENIAPNNEQKQKSTEKNNCDESKKSFNVNQRLFEQVSNSNNFSFPRQNCHLKVAIEGNRAQDGVDVVVPSDNAAVEPQEMAHVPEMHTDNTSNSTSNYSPLRCGSLKRGSGGVNKDTATILQELALQRLSGGESIGARRRYDSDSVRDRRSFDSEIGREIVREHKMKQELEHARGKFENESLASGNNQK